MSTSNKAKSICVFCYKSAVNTCTPSHHENVIGSNKTETSTVVKRFFKLLERYLQNPGKAEPWIYFKRSNVLACCDICLEALESFCEEYHQLKCLQLQLEWKLQRLVSVMKLAGRVASRVDKLQEVFQSRVSSAHSHNNEGEESGGDCLTNYKIFRHTIIKSCTRHLKKSQPRVSLKRGLDRKDERTGHPSRLTKERGRACVKMEHGNSELFHQGNNMIILGWIMSFAAVIDLLSYDRRHFPHFKTGDVLSEYTDNVTSDSPDMKLDVLNECDLLIPQVEPEVIDDKGDNFCGPESNQNCHHDSVPLLSPVATDDTAKLEAENKTDDALMSADNFPNHDGWCSLGLVEVSDVKISIPSSIPLVTNSLGHGNATKRNDSISSCPKCHQTFPSERQLKTHLTSVHLTKRHLCLECGKRFGTKLLLKLHRRIHRDPETWNFKCTLCEKRFYNTSSLKYHMKTHARGTYQNRKLCYTQFPYPPALLAPTTTKLARKRNAGKAKLFCCSHCYSTFTCKKSLDSHIASIHSGASYQCSKCSKSFNRKCELARHNTVHLDPSAWKFPCSICDKIFYRKGNLDKHIITHLTHDGPETTENTNVLSVPREIDQNLQNDSTPLLSRIINNIISHDAPCDVIHDFVPNCQRPPSFLVEDNVPEEALFTDQFSDFQSEVCDTIDPLEATECVQNEIDVGYINIEDGNNIEQPETTRSVGAITPEKSASQFLGRQVKELGHQCVDCGKSFKRKEILQRHTFIHKDPSTWKFQCNLCEKRFYLKCSLRLHMHTHSKGKEIKCNFCSRQFTNTIELLAHVRLDHAGEGQDAKHLSCPICGRMFIKKASLKQHVEGVHSARSLHTCTKCGKIFKSQDNMNQHALIHADPSTWAFQCSDCGKRFYRKSNLEIHMLTHQALKAQPKIVRTGILRQSVLIHRPGPAKFQCSRCRYVCNNKRRMKTHMFIHGKDQSAKCQICGSQFTEARALNLHIRKEHIDKGDVGSYTVFCCTQCDRKYIDKEKLRQHVGHVHVARRHQCSECNKAFMYRCQLNKHAITHKVRSS